MEGMLKVSSNPHIKSKLSTDAIMLIVIVALMCPTGFGIYHFGLRALFVLITCVVSCVLAEFLFGLCVRKFTITDLSAVVTGILLALNLPVSIPYYMAAIGSVFAIVIAKCLFGGLGRNFMNPALAGRCFLLISFPQAMTDFGYDAFTGATPLAMLKAKEEVNVYDMFTGNIAGTIGETSAIAILAGAIILLLFGVIDLRVPFSYIASFAVFVIIFGGYGLDLTYVTAQICGGGLLLGAFFMATDYVTRPVTRNGQYIYGIILGILTGLFRLFGPGAEGVSYGILLGNLMVPLIEKWTVPKYFGFTKDKMVKKGD